MSYVALLGRQPELSLAELEQVFGRIALFGDMAATFDSVETPDVQKLGGTIKLGHVVAEFKSMDWVSLSRKLVREYTDRLRNSDGKITLGLSVYGRDVPSRDIQRTGLMLKSGLKKHNVSLRLIPNDDTALSTATSHHNKLGLSANKLELIILYGDRSILVAESLGTQNITALAARDQARPKTDAFVGMLPPKLALMMINLSGITQSKNDVTVLDPFCGTGVVLQEAMLLGHAVYGTDLSEKMIRYSRDNLNWLQEKMRISSEWRLHEGDAIEVKWSQPISAVVTETYLGQPFSAPPAPDKLTQVRRTVDIIVTKFLENLHSQVKPGTPLCLAVPAWRDARGQFTHLPLVQKLSALGYEWQELESVDTKQLIYYREDQIVARQLLLLTRR